MFSTWDAQAEISSLEEKVNQLDDARMQIRARLRFKHLFKRIATDRYIIETGR